MEPTKPKLKHVRRYASLVRAFASGIDEPAEYLESFIEFDNNGNTVKETKFLKDGSPEEISSFVYDDKNKLLENTLEYVPDEASEKRQLERDGEGRVIRETKFYGDMAGEHVEYSYDEDRITEIKSFDEEGDYLTREEILYDDKKQLISRTVFDKDNAVQEKKEYRHADDGQAVEENIFDGKGQLQKTTLTRINADKKETDSVEKTGQGKLISATHTTYDAHGNVLERRIKDYFSKRHVFAYDEQNRCIEEALYDEHGTLLRRQQFDYDSDGRLLAEQSYEMDVTRGGRDKHLAVRYEYGYYEA